MRDLAIEEAIKMEIKSTLTHSSESYVKWCYLSDEEINKTG